MVSGRQRLTQLRIIYVPKVLLCISYSLLPFTLLLSLRQLPCTKPFTSSPCAGREEVGCLSCACNGLHTTESHARHQVRTASFRREHPLPRRSLPRCSARTPTHGQPAQTSQRICWGWSSRNQVMELQEPVGKLRDVFRKSKSQIATVSCWQL